jgi:hypothetical protein
MAIPSENQFIETKPVIPWRGERARKTQGRKMKDSFAMLLKTNGEKMSVYWPLAMLMKISKLACFSRDPYEKKEQ